MLRVHDHLNNGKLTDFASSGGESDRKNDTVTKFSSEDSVDYVDQMKVRHDKCIRPILRIGTPCCNVCVNAQIKEEDDAIENNADQQDLEMDNFLGDYYPEEVDDTYESSGSKYYSE